MFELVVFSITIICTTCTVVFIVPKVHEIKDLKVYHVAMFERVLFKNTITCITCAVVFNLPKRNKTKSSL